MTGRWGARCCKGPCGRLRVGPGNRWDCPPASQVLQPEHQTHAPVSNATFPDQDSRVKADHNTTNLVSKFTLSTQKKRVNVYTK